MIRTLVGYTHIYIHVYIQSIFFLLFCTCNDKLVTKRTYLIRSYKFQPLGCLNRSISRRRETRRLTEFFEFKYIRMKITVHRKTHEWRKLLVPKSDYLSVSNTCIVLSKLTGNPTAYRPKWDDDKIVFRVSIFLSLSAGIQRHVATRPFEWLRL